MHASSSAGLEHLVAGREGGFQLRTCRRSLTASLQLRCGLTLQTLTLLPLKISVLVRFLCYQLSQTRLISQQHAILEPIPELTFGFWISPRFLCAKLWARAIKGSVRRS